LIASTSPEFGEQKAVSFLLLRLFGSAKPKLLLSGLVGRSVRALCRFDQWVDNFIRIKFVAETDSIG
jgi:hypothetical protein